MRIGNKRFVLLIVALSVVIKLIFLFASGAHDSPGVFEYEQVANNLLDGKGFYYVRAGVKYYGGIAPAYPILCYSLYKLFGHHTILIVALQILVTSFLAIPVYLIARAVFSEKTARLSAFLCAIQPQLIIYSTTKLHSMNVYAFIFAFMILAFLKLRDDPAPRNIFFTGFIVGLAVLFRVTSLALALLAAVWFCFTARCGNRKKFHALALIILISFILGLPWGVRNYVVFGRPVFLQTNKWESLWYGNMPGSSGSLYTEGGVSIPEKGRKDLPENFFEMNEKDQGECLKKLTIGYFRKDPAAFAGRIFKKIGYFWYFSPYQGSLYPKNWFALYRIYYIFVLTLAVFSIIRCFTGRRNVDRNAVMLILLLFLAITGVHSLYFVEGRHRWSIESLLLIFTADGFFILKDIFKRVIKQRNSA